MQKSKDNRKYKNYRPAAINCFYESPAAVYVLVQKNRKCLTARHRKYSMADKIKTATNLDGKINPSNTWRALDIPFHPYDRPPAKHRFQPNTKNPKVGTSM